MLRTTPYCRSAHYAICRSTDDATCPAACGATYFANHRAICCAAYCTTGNSILRTCNCTTAPPRIACRTAPPPVTCTTSPRRLQHLPSKEILGDVLCCLPSHRECHVPSHLPHRRLFNAPPVLHPPSRRVLSTRSVPPVVYNQCRRVFSNHRGPVSCAPDALTCLLHPSHCCILCTCL